MNEPKVDGPRLHPHRSVTTIAAVTAVLLAGLALVACGGTEEAGASTIRLQPAAVAGPDPFSESVAVGPATGYAGQVRSVSQSTTTSVPRHAATGTAVVTGTAPGLYGGTGDRHVCDAGQLVKFLDAHPDKARAWAKVLGVARDGIEKYVAALTPVLLTADTRVTNHGFRHGTATAEQSVLQAGTAVMVDTRGVPRVKCNCGNPLTPPQPLSLRRTAVSGTRWPGYSTTRIVTVRPGAPVQALDLVNVSTGATYRAPVGSAGSGSSGPDGTWTIHVSDPTAEGCGPGSLDGLHLVLTGGRATIPADGRYGDFAGTVKNTGNAVTISVERPGDQPADITLTATSNGDSQMSGSSEFGGIWPSGQTGFECKSSFTATKDGAGIAPAPPTAAPPTTAGIATLPAGLKCKDLVARGIDYAGAVDYWNAHGHPSLMDADGNGVPCETVFPASTVAAYWAGHGGSPATPTTVATGKGHGPCDVATIRRDVETATEGVLGVHACDGTWAAISTTFKDTGDEGAALLHWNGSRWAGANCEDYWEPSDPMKAKPGTVPPDEWVACTVS